MPGLATPRWWQNKNWLAILLWPLSVVYALLSQVRKAQGLRIAAQIKHKKALPFTIVVGNIYSGGVGKTPVCLAILQHLLARKFNVGVVSRGYARSDTTDHLLVAPFDAKRSGDEAVLLAMTGAPVAVAFERNRAVGLLGDVQIVLSDDGLQHYKMPRNLELVLQDERGIGNGMLLPSGPLRECANRRRDATLLRARNTPPHSDPSQQQFWFRDQLGDCFSLLNPAQSQPLAMFQTQTLYAVAGIGNPEAFFAMLRDHGLQINPVALADHSHEVERTVAALPGSAPILLTMKDAIKCQALHSAQTLAASQWQRVWVVRHQVELDPQFLLWLDEQLHSIPSA